MKRWIAILACACGSGATTPPTVAPERAPKPLPIVTVDPPQPALRLPRHFTPTGYTSRLAIDPAKPAFDGEISIAGIVTEPTRVIWLHGKNLSIKSARAKRGGIAVKLAVTPRGDDLLEVRAGEALLAGAWTLELAYTGKIVSDAIYGAFVTKQGPDPYIATHFEPLEARRVWPSIDEPDRKVPWQLTLDVPSSLVAVSNTPAVRTTALDAKRSRVEFARTRPLPTYLLAFAVGPFEIVDAGKSKSGVPVRIVTPRGTVDRTGWVAKATPRLIDLLEAWFGTPFPYPKVDIIVPPTMMGNAMEDAGAIMTDPASAFVDRDNPSWKSRHDVTFTIGHELAHHWFGDLVTPAWWDDLWLKEGFATWMENLIGTWFDPSWGDLGQFVSVRNAALHSDALISARRVREAIVDSAGINNAFDSITYQKGASVLRMVERYVGEATFQKGVQKYLGAHVDGVATLKDLLRTLEETSGKPLAPIFDSFLDQAGAPVVTMELACGPSPRVKLEQHRFRAVSAPKLDHDPTWRIPMCLVHERDGKRARTCGMLDQRTGEIPLPGGCPAWVMSNADGDGYYYTALTGKDVDTLRDKAWPHLTTVERRVVLEDARAQTLLGKLPVASLMSIATKLLAIDDKLAVGDALGGTDRYSALNRMTGLPYGLGEIVEPKLRQDVQRKVRAMLGARARDLGIASLPTDDWNREVTRQAILRSAAAAREPALAKQAITLAERYRTLPSAIRPLVLELAVFGSPAFADRLYNDVRAEPDSDRRHDMLTALVKVPDPVRRKKHLDLALDPKLDAADIAAILLTFDEEPTRMAIEQWIRANWPALQKRLPPPGELSTAASLGEIFTAACDPARRDEIAAYVTKQFGGYMGGALQVKQQIEQMDQCIAQRALVGPSLRAWLGLK